MLILLLVVKFLFSAVSFGSGAPGGIFFPLLILGSYLGAAYGDVVIQYCNIPDAMWTQFIILGMAGLFAGIVRAPLTGIVLITEMTGSMNRFLDVALVSIVAYFVANLVGSKPIYTSLLENILKRSSGTKHSKEL
jgi:H+/Cl- antiporter ClcA